LTADFTLADRLERGLGHLRGISSLGARALVSLFTKPMNFADFVQQVELIGQKSTAIAVLTAIFSSMVMTVQFASQLGRFGAKAYVGTIVSLSLVRELGPVLTALMVGGRVGAGIAAELGSMAVTEQIDAIRSMGADPVRKLVVPRVAAAIVIMPLLTAMSNLLGVLGAMVVAFLTSDVNMLYFLTATMQAVDISDLMGGLMKTLFFGFFISVIACYRGLSTTGGTEGVGRATTETVVLTSVVTLISDFVLTSILLQFGL
jgi:phospholipid/cholesterol/gamma-HCH transport system permease protein